MVQWLAKKEKRELIVLGEWHWNIKLSDIRMGIGSISIVESATIIKLGYGIEYAVVVK